MSYARRCAGQDKQPVWQLDVGKGEGEVGLSSSSTHTPSAQSHTLMGVWSRVVGPSLCWHVGSVAAVSRLVSTVPQKNLKKSKPNAVGVLFFWVRGEEGDRRHVNFLEERMV